jgi:serine/threonine protein kinase
MEALPDDDARAAFAKIVLKSVKLTLDEAAARGIHHGDIRPSNIIVVVSDDTVHVFVIDWGLGCNADGVSVGSDRCHGVPCYLSDAKLRASSVSTGAMTAASGWTLSKNDDLAALGYTFLSIFLPRSALPAQALPVGVAAASVTPWSDEWVIGDEAFLQRRRKWIDTHVAPALRDFDDEIVRGVIQCSCGNDNVAAESSPDKSTNADSSYNDSSQ